MVFGHLKLKGMQGYFWKRLSSDYPFWIKITYFKSENMVKWLDNGWVQIHSECAWVHMAYYPLHSISSWTGVLSLTRWKLSTFQDYFYYLWVRDPPIVFSTWHVLNLWEQMSSDT